MTTADFGKIEKLLFCVTINDSQYTSRRAVPVAVVVEVHSGKQAFKMYGA
jgi:hypothetical protein